MSLETGTRIVDLVATNPVGATDFASQGDDHIRLIKACLQGSFPSLGATAVTATAEELNGLHSLTASKAVATNSSGIAVASSTSDAELDGLHALTASRALVTTAGGILIASATTATELGYVSGVTSAIQTQLGALSSSITALSSSIVAGYQPLDSDLTALAALTTASYGRDFNTLANNAALATKIAALVPTWTGLHTFSSGNISLVAGSANTQNYIAFGDTTSSGATAYMGWAAATNDLIQGSARGDMAFRVNTARFLWSADSGSTINVKYDSTNLLQINDAGSFREYGFRHLPVVQVSSTPYTHSAADNGKGMRNTTGSAVTHNLPLAAVGTVITIVNDAAGVMTLQGSGGATIYWYSGAGRVGPATRTLAAGSVATCWNIDGTAWAIWGNGIS